MSIIKYNTNDFRPTTFRSIVDRILTDDFAGGSLSGFTPSVDVIENEKSFEIQLHVSGMNKEDFEIDIKKDKVTISGERKRLAADEDIKFHSVESYYGKFSRAFVLPEIIDRDQIDAVYENGVLTVTLPKDQTKAEQKQILVR